MTHQFEDQTKIPKTTTKLDPFKILLHKISKELTSKDEEVLEHYVNEIISGASLEQLTSPLQIFNKLHTLGVIKPNDLGWMEEYLDAIDQHKLLQLIKDFKKEERHRSLPQPFQRHLKDQVQTYHAPFNVPTPSLLIPPKTQAEDSPEKAPVYPPVDANLSPVACFEETPHVLQPTNTPDIQSSTKESVNTPFPVSESGQYPAECTETPSGNLNVQRIQHAKDGGLLGGTNYQGASSQVKCQSSSAQERSDIEKRVHKPEANLQRPDDTEFSPYGMMKRSKSTAETFRCPEFSGDLNLTSNQHKLHTEGRKTAQVKPVQRKAKDVHLGETHEETEVKTAGDETQSSQEEMDPGGIAGLERPLQGLSATPQESMEPLKAEWKELNPESRSILKRDMISGGSFEINHLEDDNKVSSQKIHIDGPSDSSLFRRNHIRKAHKDIDLYNYQMELAAVALEGRNCILCAPTGSGKTLTAGYVCHTKWQEAKSMRKRHKTLFIVCIRNLISQQTEALQLIFKEDPNRSNVVAGINEVQTLSTMLKTQDVIVLTAQILVNSLRNKEVSLDDFDLLIMDECHHTNLRHPYNIIMEFYLDEKGASPGKPLPQVLGLTASLGVGNNKDDALSHYILLCANLDCNNITHVRNEDNLAELYMLNPKPQRDQIISVSTRDPNDKFSHILTNMMKEIEGYQCLQELPKQTHQWGSQQYENWVVENRLKAESNDLQDAIYCCQTLQTLNSALMFYDELQGKEVIKMLKEYFIIEKRPGKPRSFEGQIYILYDEQITKLEDAARMEKIFDNSKLERLSQLLDDLYDIKPESKGILLTRTRTSVDGLVAFIKSQRVLRDLVRPARFVGQGRKDSTMTDVEQESTLMSFKSDDDKSFNLLVATDVAQEGIDMPRCNFVIRYNFVSNEIGSVQSRGRARAKNSECYLIVNKNSINEAREYENLEKEHLMLEALKDIDKKNTKELDDLISKKQALLLKERLAKQEERLKMANMKAPELVDIVCKNCKLFLCNGENIRKRGSNFIVIDQKFEDRTKQTPRFKPLNFRDDSHVGMVHCGKVECSRKLGPVVKYNKGSRRTGYVLNKDAVMWRQHNAETEYNQIKQWSKVPFHITEEAISD